MNNRELRVVRIVEGTSVDGPGLRTSIYFAGCDHGCPGCHNPQTWSPHAGVSMSVDELVERVDKAGFNVTLTGGDPLQQSDIRTLTEFVRLVVALGYHVWCYTGYTFEEVAVDAKFSSLLSLLDVLVDGPYVEAKRDLSLRFRGSSNQRLVDLKRSSVGNVVEWS